MKITLGPATPVEINQIAWEFEEALLLYRAIAPKRVLEIGTAAGGTLYHWLQNAAPETVVVSVDIDMGQITQETADSWVAEPDVECVLIQGDTRAPWTQEQVREHGPYDWLFIDGCHEYEFSLNDWEVFRPMCNPRSYVLFHDIALQRQYGNGTVAGVERLWREIQAEGYWTRESRANPTLTWYGIGVVKLP